MARLSKSVANEQELPLDIVIAGGGIAGLTWRSR